MLLFWRQVFINTENIQKIRKKSSMTQQETCMILEIISNKKK
jgi:hypothetical protein